MMKGGPEAPVEAAQALLVLRRSFGNTLHAVYLHGSAVTGGLRRYSDVDLLAVIDQPTTPAVRELLAAELVHISGRYPALPGGRRPIELIVFQRADLTPPAYPARSEFVYGEWLRDAFDTGMTPQPASDPEYTLLLAQARLGAKTLFGPQPTELLPIISRMDIRRATGDALPTLLGTLEGDERNVILTLARMWRTVVVGDFVSKDVAAEWARHRLSAKAANLLDRAKKGYLNGDDYDWTGSREEVRQLVKELGERVAALLPSRQP